MHDLTALAGVKRSIIGANVEIRGLRKAYGDFVAVHNLDLEVEAGEFLTLLGPSGSGKTTTLSAVAGFISPTAGEIFIGGSSVRMLPPEKRNIGVVFQNYALFPHMTVAENIAFPLRMRSMPASRTQQMVADAIGSVQLDRFIDRYPAQLSGGQQQRVALARSIVFEPPVILFDEPLGALDKALREDMQILLRRLHRESRTTMIYVTHDQEEALLLSDRIAVMNEGVLEQVDTPDRVYNHPATRFAAQFVGESNFISGQIEQRNDNDIAVQCGRHRFYVAAPDANAFNGKVDIMVRPEKIRVGDVGPDCENRASGTVIERLFVGNRTKLAIRLTCGTTIQASLHGNEPRMTTNAIGEDVEVGWKARDTRVFPLH